MSGIVLGLMGLSSLFLLSLSYAGTVIKIPPYIERELSPRRSPTYPGWASSEWQSQVWPQAL